MIVHTKLIVQPFIRCCHWCYCNCHIIQLHTTHHHTTPYHTPGIPKNASFHSQVTTGVYPTAFDVNLFGLAHQSKTGKETDTRYKVTADECMPTTLVQFVRNPDGSLDLNTSITQEWFNVVLGIPDPSVFVPNENCKLPPP